MAGVAPRAGMATESARLCRRRLLREKAGETQLLICSLLFQKFSIHGLRQPVWGRSKTTMKSALEPQPVEQLPQHGGHVLPGHRLLLGRGDAERRLGAHRPDQMDTRVQRQRLNRPLGLQLCKDRAQELEVRRVAAHTDPIQDRRPINTDNPLHARVPHLFQQHPQTRHKPLPGITLSRSHARLHRLDVLLADFRKHGREKCGFVGIVIGKCPSGHTRPLDNRCCRGVAITQVGKQLPARVQQETPGPADAGGVRAWHGHTILRSQNSARLTLSNQPGASPLGDRAGTEMGRCTYGGSNRQTSTQRAVTLLGIPGGDGPG